jgi:hypothetical protein
MTSVDQLKGSAHLTHDTLRAADNISSSAVDKRPQRGR